MASKLINSFFSTCVYVVIVMFVFVLLFNVVGSLGFFTTASTPGGPYLGEEGHTIAQESGGFLMDNIWAIALTGGVGGVLLAVLTHSTAILGIYLFSAVFWAMYGNLLSILSVGNLLTGTLWNFVVIGTAVMIIVFVAAIAGMLSGSG